MVSALPTIEHELIRRFTASPQVFIDSLAGLLSQFKPDGLPCLPLADGGPISRMAVGRDILDLQRNDITGSELAIDG